jgi:hypothetical protein
VTDPRPGFEPVDRPWGGLRRLPILGWWLLAGLVGGLLIVLGPSDRRDHMLGGTDEVSALVVRAETEEACDTGERAVYTLGWHDETGTARTSVFRRCGPLRHETGDRIDVWVTPERSEATDESPAELWLFAVLVMPSVGVVIGWLVAWRQRMWARAAARGLDRRRRREAGAVEPPT